ncbi:unnamed protein product [Notodromas monacha]|uniref:Peptidase M12A domain-containing protein n=1 Tax=Notodromas monacha TaxID=399045 RepID=A0A7R9GHS8_9CRUS|nr:unnamed protein product [Notodromas monacha]CAG0921108.1 unnamed protein product [Notodromas monacha]
MLFGILCFKPGACHLQRRELPPDPEGKFAFEKLSISDAHDAKYGYDMDSIMHYDSYGFGKINPVTGRQLQTIFVKADPSRIISRAEVLSPGNVEEIHQVYDELCTNKLKYKKPAAKIFRWVMRFIRRVFNALRNSG